MHQTGDRRSCARFARSSREIGLVLLQGLRALEVQFSHCPLQWDRDGGLHLNIGVWVGTLVSQQPGEHGSILQRPCRF